VLLLVGFQSKHDTVHARTVHSHLQTVAEYQDAKISKMYVEIIFNFGSLCAVV
jgi:hypothetical protein